MNSFAKGPVQNKFEKNMFVFSRQTKWFFIFTDSAIFGGIMKKPLVKWQNRARERLSFGAAEI